MPPMTGKAKPKPNPKHLKAVPISEGRHRIFVEHVQEIHTYMVVFEDPALATPSDSKGVVTAMVKPWRADTSSGPIARAVYCVSMENNTYREFPRELLPALAAIVTYQVGLPLDPSDVRDWRNHIHAEMPDVPGYGPRDILRRKGGQDSADLYGAKGSIDLRSSTQATEPGAPAPSPQAAPRVPSRVNQHLAGADEGLTFRQA